MRKFFLALFLLFFMVSIGWAEPKAPPPIGPNTLLRVKALKTTPIAFASLPASPSEGDAYVINNASDSCTVDGGGATTIVVAYLDGAWSSLTCAGSISDVDDLPGDVTDDNLIDDVILDTTVILASEIDSVAKLETVTSGGEYMSDILGAADEAGLIALMPTYFNQVLLNTSNPAFNTINVVGTNSLNLGTASTNTGQVTLKNSTNANTFTLQAGATGANLTWTLPTAAAGGDAYLLNVNAAGTMGLTDPATFTGEPTTYEQLSTNSDIDTNLADGATASTVPSSAAAKDYADSVAGAPTNVTPVDTADENATFYLIMVDGATGSQATETDAGLSFNPSTNVFTASGGVASGPSATPNFYMRDSDATAGDDNYTLAINATDTGDGTEDIDITEQIQIAGTPTTVRSVNADGNYTIGATGMPVAFGSNVILPTTTSGDQTLTAGMIGIKTDEDLIVTHGGAAGEVQDEAGISLIHTLIIRFDPEYEYDTITNNTIDLMEIGDEAPHGITITEWRIQYLNGDPTTEIDLDLICDTTPDWNPAAGATVMDVLDTTAGTATADTGFDSATCATGSYMYLRFGADPVDTGEIVRVKLSYYLEED